MKYSKIFFLFSFVLFNVSFSQDFDINQSQQQAVYFIDSATIGDEDVDNNDFILARTSDNVLVGVSQYNGYGTDLVVMGQDLDIVVDDETYVVCETTGTCDYPSQGDLIYLSIYDSSSSQEFLPLSVLNDGTANAVTTQQTVIFSTLINVKSSKSDNFL